jgi:diacylglycerol kinase (ATP)
MTKALRRRALMLINPNARRGSDSLAPVIARLEQGGVDVKVERFETPGEVSPDIERRRDEADLVIVCGGDGTINSAAKGIMATGLPLGILPMGTANDLARTLHIPDDLLAAADLILSGKTRKIDIGEVNGHPFFNVASMGLGATLANSLSREAKRRWGKFGYAFAAAKVMLAARPFTATILTKYGSVAVKSLQIAVGNGRHYGGGTIVEADAAIDDGYLDLYSLEQETVLRLLLLLGSFRQGTHGAWDEVRTDKCVEFDIRTKRPMPINTDGDLVTFTPAHCIIRPSAITVFA